MIIECKSCKKKFLVNDQDIPPEGRQVQCGICSQKWFQKPVTTKTENYKPALDKRDHEEIIQASDGKTYKFLGMQWAEFLPSGKTGKLAKSVIAIELNDRVGKQQSRENLEKGLNDINPSLEEESISSKKSKNRGLGFFGSIFVVLIAAIFIIGILETFKDELIVYWPDLEFYLEYVYETFQNLRVIFRDLFYSYY